jgi:putative redox protein
VAMCAGEVGWGLCLHSKNKKIIYHLFRPLNMLLRARLFHRGCRIPLQARGLSRPSANLHVYRVTGRGAGGASTSTVRGHDIRTDLPRAAGGQDSAPQPVELVIAALIGCKVATATYAARHMMPRFPDHTITFDLQAQRDPRGALALPLHAPTPALAQLSRVWGTARVCITDPSRRHLESTTRLQTLHEHVEARCPVAAMLRASGCVMDVSWSFDDNFGPGSSI